MRKKLSPSAQPIADIVRAEANAACIRLMAQHKEAQAVDPSRTETQYSAALRYFAHLAQMSTHNITQRMRALPGAEQIAEYSPALAVVATAQNDAELVEKYNKSRADLVASRRAEQERQQALADAPLRPVEYWREYSKKMIANDRARATSTRLPYPEITEEWQERERRRKVLEDVARETVAAVE